MGKLPLQKKINIVGIGIITSILVFLLMYAVFARTLDLFLGEGNDLGLLFIVISLELIAFIASIMISIWQTDDLPDNIVLKTAFVAFVINVVFLCVLSYGTLLVLYPIMFEGLSIPDAASAFPTVLLNFGIYVLGHPIYLFILSIIMYYFFFIIFIEVYYPKQV